MRRLLILSVILACLAVGFAAQLSAQQASAPVWLAEFRFVAPPNLLGDDAQAGGIALTLTNLNAGNAKNVLVQVSADARVGFGPDNSEQLGAVKQGAMGFLHTQLLLAKDAKSFPITVTWKDESGASKTIKLDAVLTGEVAQ